MSPETKARLAEKAQARKGRDTLMGLAHGHAYPAFDYITELRDAGMIPPAMLGMRHRNPQAVILVWAARWGERESVARDGAGGYAQPKTRAVGTEKWTYTVPGLDWERVPCPWIGCKYCPEWIIDGFAERFGCRRVAVEEPSGPTRIPVSVTKRVVPIAPVVAWFRFIWGDPVTDAAERIAKYCIGYTDEYTRQCPGIGQRVRVCGPWLIPEGLPLVGDVCAVGSAGFSVRWGKDATDVASVPKTMTGYTWEILDKAPTK